MTNPLEALKKALEESPKSKKGFVNWSTNRKLQYKAVCEMVELGEESKEAMRKAWNVGRHFDTNYHKHPDR